MDAQRLLDGLNESQIAAVVTPGGPIVVHAGAGSGKTRVLTRRIAYRILKGENDPRYVLSLTFTRKAANELQSRLQKLGMRDHVVAGTFHSVALTQLRRRWEERGITPPNVLDRKYAMVSQLVGRRKNVEVMDVIGEIEWARARMIEPAFYHSEAEKAGRTPPVDADDFVEIMEGFAQQKRRRRVVDFDDILGLALRDLRADPGYADAVRWRHRHLYVDEFQDVNPLQNALLNEWRGDSDDIFVVGDPHQAIYGWNGANPFLITDFPQREPRTTVINLNHNYRSSAQILTLAKAALAGKGNDLIANQGDGPVPTVESYEDETAEAIGIADAVRQSRAPSEGWNGQAVLVRTNAQLVPIEQALAGAGIPVRIRGGKGPLATPEVREVIKRIGRPGIDFSQAVETFAAELEEPLEDPSPNEAERYANKQALLQVIRNYTVVDPRPSGPDFLAWLATIQANEVHRDSDAVDLSTFHGSKGLEWPVVHLAGLEQGFVPISYAETGAQLAEERRLLYVAITRAERELHLSYAEERTFRTKPTSRRPSPYLGEIERAIEHLNRGLDPNQYKVLVSDARKQLGKVKKKKTDDGNDDPVFKELRTWRYGQSKAHDVPAYVVLNDATLKAIAKKRPTTKGQLANIQGIGPTKLDRYGDAILKIVKAG
ncbi:MAG: ATP-dependent DNA helicase UvrD2 [Acidimicrobiales bacterium]|nr:ATP-dependent DNA helicase UvrD2 [Acidimicrobiales bacterium]